MECNSLYNNKHLLGNLFSFEETITNLDLNKKSTSNNEFGSREGQIYVKSDLIKEMLKEAKII